MSLKDELVNDPLGIGYAGMSNAEVETSLNAKNRTMTVPTEIGVGLVLETLGLADGNALLDLSKNTTDFRHVWPVLEQGRLRVDSVLVRNTLDGLAMAGAITQSSADALKALGEQACSRAVELGVQALDFDIIHARAT